jgi:hypothetical protein
MEPIIINTKTLEIDGKIHELHYWPVTLETLITQHPDKQIYLYEPPIVVSETETINPTEWTPVDPIFAIII